MDAPLGQLVALTETSNILFAGFGLGHGRGGSKAHRQVPAIGDAAAPLSSALGRITPIGHEFDLCVHAPQRLLPGCSAHGKRFTSL